MNGYYFWWISYIYSTFQIKMIVFSCSVATWEKHLLYWTMPLSDFLQLPHPNHTSIQESLMSDYPPVSIE